jgi:hypothetical protein
MRSVRRQVVRCSLVALGAVAMTLLPTPAWADGPDRITVSGDELAEPVEVSAAEFPLLVEALDNEVNWLVGRSSNADEPDEDARGPAYVLEVHIDGETRHRYVLYPLAEGGPRVFRPAEQPGNRKTTEGWFYGRLSLPDTLSAAGVPVEGAQPRLPGGGAPPGGGTGGGNGGAGEPSPESTVGLLNTWRDGMQLTVLVALAIAAGLAAVALLIRRKV